MRNKAIRLRGSGKKEFTGRHMLWLMLAFFGVVLLANGTLVIVAMNNWSGLVVPNSYVASQKFNAAVDEAQMRAGKDWRGSLKIGEDGRAVLTLLDGKGVAVAGRQVQGDAARPTHEKADQDLTFREVGSGTYQVQEDLAAGVWLLTVKVEGHQRLDYAHRFRLTVP